MSLEKYSLDMPTSKYERLQIIAQLTVAAASLMPPASDMNGAVNTAFELYGRICADIGLPHNQEDSILEDAEPHSV